MAKSILRRKKTALERQYLAIRSHDDQVHQWLCHPGEECQDGCDCAARPERLRAMTNVEGDLYEIGLL